MQHTSSAAVLAGVVNAQGQLFRRFETVACDLGFLRLHIQAKVAEGREIAGRDGTPLADLDFGADSRCFDFGAPAELSITR